MLPLAPAGLLALTKATSSVCHTLALTDVEAAKALPSLMACGLSSYFFFIYLSKGGVVVSDKYKKTLKTGSKKLRIAFKVDRSLRPVSKAVLIKFLK
jgi:hypothetical protein